MEILIFLLTASIIGSLECRFLAKRQTNLCSNSPCLNGGKCVQIATNLAYCACANGYTGATCNISPTTNVLVSTTVSPSTTSFIPVTTTSQLCITGICKNGGTCVAVPNYNFAYCKCSVEYTGPFCDIPSSNPTSTMSPSTTTTTIATTTATGSLCTSNVCKNGGTCVEIPGANLAYCKCVNGYTGSFCDLPPATTTSPTTSVTTVTTSTTISTTIPTTSTTDTTTISGAFQFCTADVAEFVCKPGEKCLVSNGFVTCFPSETETTTTTPTLPTTTAAIPTTTTNLSTTTVGTTTISNTFQVCTPEVAAFACAIGQKCFVSNNFVTCSS